MENLTVQQSIERIQRHAQNQGLTPLELCRAAGIAASTWQRWKSGKFGPQLRTLRRLLAYRTDRTEKKA